MRRLVFPATTARAWVWNGRDAAGRAVPDGRYTVYVGAFDRAGNPTIRDGDGPRRPDDPVARLGTRLVRATGRWPRPADRRPPPAGDRLGGDLPGIHPGPPDLAEPDARRRAVRLDVVGQDGCRGIRQAGHVPGRGRRDELDRRARGPAAPSPSRHRSRPRDPTRLGVHDRPQPDDDRAGSGRARGPGLDRPADLQRGREPRPDDAAILEALPAATLLVVDDGSPDGTGRLADALAAADPRIRVRHRAAQAGPRARLPRRLRRGAGRRRDDGRPDGCRLVATTRPRCPAWSPRSPATRPISSSAPATRPAAASSTGASAGGSCRAAAASSRGSCSGSGQNDLTGGFKAWRATTLAAIPFDGVHAGGYVFQIEMTFRASRAGARIREVPITFRDRRVGQSKMSRRIVVEALVVVVQLRAEELLARLTRRRRS